MEQGEGTLNLNKIITKLQGQYFGVKMRLYGLLKLPAQTKKERQIFKALFDLTSKNRKLRVFEWGSGYSTLYYAQYLLWKGVDFEWHTIDNNKVWHEKVKALVRKKNLEAYVWLYLKEFKPFWRKPDWGPIPPACKIFSPKSESEMAYINFPRQLNGCFNIVIIDARFRRHCIQTTKEVLLPEGIAILHDGQKTHYHVGLDDFRSNKFLNTGSWYPFQELPNKVWIGSMGNKEVFEKLF